MFSFICGKPVEYTEATVTLENNGIGYCLFVTPAALSRCRKADMIQLYVHMAVKEDDVTLFGFYSREEKALFHSLMTVSGIGAKSALSVLSGMPLSDLIAVIGNQDVRSLSGIKGVGKKTAERIVLELKDKLGGSGDYFDAQTAAPEASDALAALLSLGIARNDAVRAINSVVGKEALKTEEVVRHALKKL